MADQSLEIRIRTLVDGLQSVQALATQMQSLVTQALSLSQSTRGAAADLQSLGQQALASDSRIEELIEALGRLGASTDDLSFNNGDLSRQMNELTTGLEGLVDGFREVPESAQDAGEKTADSLNPVKDSIDGLYKNVRNLILGFIALAGAMTLKEAADTAARTETLGVTLGIVARNAGYSAEQISKFEQELIQLGITAGASREALTQLIQSGIELTAVNAQGMSTAAQMARASQDLAVVTGENSSATLTRLITNVRQMDTVGLRYMGLTVNVTAAQERFAQSIGKSAGALTQQQKTQAVLNAAMAEAIKLQGSYEASLDTVAKQLGSMSRYQEEAANSVGFLLLPAYGELVESATELLKNMRQIADEVKDTSTFSETFGAGLGDAAEGLTEVLTSLMQLTADLAPSFGLLVQAAGELAGALGEVVSSLIDGTSETQILQTLLESLALLVAGLADGFNLIGGVISLVSGGWMKLLALMTRGLSQIVGLINKDMADGLDNVANKLDSMGDSSLKNFSKVIGDFQNGDTAVQRLITSSEKAKSVLESFGKGTDFQSVTEDIRKLTEGIRKTELTSVEAAQASNQIAESIKRLGDEGKLTEREMATLNARLGTEMANNITKYSEAVSKMGLSLRTVGNEKYFVTLNDDLGEVAGNLSTLADNSNTTAAQFAQAFSKGIDTAKSVDDINTLTRTLEQAGKRGFDVSNSLSEVRSRLDEVFNADLSASNTEGEIAVLRKSLEDLAAAGVITEAQLDGMMRRITDRVKSVAAELTNADILGPLQALGIPLSTLTSGLTEAGKVGVNAMRSIITAMTDVNSEAELTGEQFLKVFNNSLGTAKSVQDLSALVVELKRAKDEGALFGQTYRDAMDEATLKFNELFAAQLKTANTKTEFQALTASVKEMGASGVISSQQVAMSLAEIQEKATGAKASLQSLAQQNADLAEQQVSAARASTAVERANVDLERQKRSLTEATTRAKKDNTKENQLLLNIQRQLVAQAEQEKRVAEARYRYELAQVDLLIAKQRELNAEKKVELNPDDPAALAAVAAARQEADQRELVVQKTREAVAAQEKLAEATAKSVEQAKAYAEQMGVATKETEKTASSNSLVGKSIVAFGAEAIARYQQTLRSQRALAEAQERQAIKAQELTEEYSRTAAKAQAVADGVVTAAQATELFRERTSEVAQAMQQVKLQAMQTVKATQDSVTGFLSSSNSIRQELLSAMGQEDVASRERYAQRRSELDLEYQMLRVKIQAAMAQAQAAGVSTAGLSKSLADANASYDEAVNNLSRLEQIEDEARRKREADAQAETQQREAALAAEKAGVASVADERARMYDAEGQSLRDLANTRAAQEGAQGMQQEMMQSMMSPVLDRLSDSLGRSSDPTQLQSIAKDGAKVDKVIEHKFQDSQGNQVTATVASRDSDRFVDLLDELRRRSS